MKIFKRQPVLKSILDESGFAKEFYFENDVKQNKRVFLKSLSYSSTLILILIGIFSIFGGFYA